MLNYKIYTTMKNLKQRLHSKTREGVGGRQGEPEQERERERAAKQKVREKEFNLATVLISTTTTFFALHLPRLLTSFYEALNITAQLDCAKKGMDFFPLWFLFAIVAMNILLVINASSNILIYTFVGNSFREQLLKIFHICNVKSLFQRQSTQENIELSPRVKKKQTDAE